jgi:hypothetical protein
MQETTPSRCRPGDIVEAEISFVVFPLRDRYKMSLILRSVAILDCKETEVIHTLLLENTSITK